ncbi:uncharacterized protein LOC143276941 [Babylonia areolata]|uniref:uncharacterized protein LOC143276941 n=1 Tax=Babylonia areolata TaxID=304850 RepID=UPI003FD2CEE9
MVQPEDMPEPEQPGETAEGAGGEAASSATKTDSSPTPSKPPAPKPKTGAHKGYAFLFKYVLVGDCGVGKTSLLKRFSNDIFVETHVYTIGVDFDIKTVELPNGDAVKLQMWDTAGQERFRTITTSYYRGSNGVIVVYDTTDEESFISVPRWVTEVQRYCSEDTECIVVGTKSDLASRGSAESYGRDKVVELLRTEGLMPAEGATREEGGGAGVLGVFEVSAKTGQGVSEAFQSLTDVLVARHLDDRNPLRGGKGRGRGRGRGAKVSPSGHDTVHLGKAGMKPKSRCC